MHYRFLVTEVDELNRIIGQATVHLLLVDKQIPDFAANAWQKISSILA